MSLGLTLKYTLNTEQLEQIRIVLIR